MNEEVSFVIEEAAEGMNNALLHLDKEFQKIRAGKASPAMLEGVRVDYYGALTAIDQVSNINTPGSEADRCSALGEKHAGAD
jgi:ribosome recycling factor